MISLKIKKLGSKWYPCIDQECGYLYSFSDKLNKYFFILDRYKKEELTIDFEEQGIIVEDFDTLYFNEEDIVRYLTTEDNFDLRVTINDHTFLIGSDLYWMLENELNFNFHKSIYNVSIW